MTDSEAMVQVLCKVDRQVGDDLYVHGNTYTMPLARAEKYTPWFDIQEVVRGDDLDRMRKDELIAYANQHGIEFADTVRNNEDRRAAIRAAHAE